LAKGKTASSEKDAREKHSVGLGRQVPRTVTLEVYVIEPHRHPERIASSYPSSVSDKPSSSWSRFKAAADGGRVRKAFAGQEEVVVPYTLLLALSYADGPGRRG
jgi:hypothetical protein